MGVVMIKCPQTGRAISTGMAADRETFRCSAVFFARSYCAICETNHEWFAKEAWVDEPHPPSSKATVKASWPMAGGAVKPRLSPRLLRVG